MITLYVPAPRRIYRYRDTDYLVSYQLLRLADYSPELRVVRSDSLAFDFRFYSRLALYLARRRLKLPIPRRWGWLLSQNYLMPVHGPEINSADAVLSYERFPINTPAPVIWMAGSTDVAELRRKRVSERDIEKNIEFKKEANAKAAVTVMPTYSKKRLFDEIVQPSKPTIVIPIFQPIEAILPETFREKWDILRPVKLLFIGRAAVRKGLALVLNAYEILQKRYPGRVLLHVVTTFQDGPVTVPSLPGLTVEESLIPHARAIELMSEYHYLLMPSILEEYGFVYIEAMARGAIPLATDSPVQRELLDEGRAGVLVNRNETDIVNAIALAVENADTARELARRSMKLWSNRYAPSVIANQYASLVGAFLKVDVANECNLDLSR